VLYGRDNTDDQREYVCLFNLNPDTIERVSIALPGERAIRLERLAMSGEWVPVGFTIQDRSIRCDADAPTMEPYILRISH
jgi:hypothetical protein